MLKTISIIISARVLPNFLTSEAKLAFLQLRQAFTKTPILHYFDPKRYIQIETNASDYAIGSIFNKPIPKSG